MQQQNKFKLTPEVRKAIKTLCGTLPDAQKRNAKGDKMFRKIAVVVRGSDLSDENKTKLGKQFKPEGNYKVDKIEAILINHEVSLTSIYQRDGEPGMKTYCDFFMNAIATADKIDNEVPEPVN